MRFLPRHLIPAAFLLVSLAGCSSGFSLGDINPFAEEEKRLPGERHAILLETDPLSVDPQAAKVPALPPARANADWPQPGGPATNAPGHLALGSTPKRAWNVQGAHGSNDEARLSASPIVYQGRVFVMDTAAQVSAYSINGGRQWSVSLRPEEEEADVIGGGGLAADGGRLFAATGFGRVVALDPVSGAQLWVSDVTVPIRSAPTAADGHVFTIGADNQIYALSAEDGSQAWSYRGIPEAAGLIANASPAVSGTTVVAPYSSGEVIAFKAETGEPIWADSLTRTQLLTSLSGINDVAARPVIDGGIVFAISVSGRMVAVDEKTGERLWTRNIAGAQAPASVGETVYVVSLSGQLVALERKSGKVRWLTKLPGEIGVRWAGPVVAGGRLWLSSSNRKMIAVDALTGEIGAQYELGAASNIAPIVASGGLFLLLDDGTLTTFF